ncbi:MAG: cellulase family glycosylhydrolase, partial [Chloroflexi bacterium]|nr:cellulase family glycosylhydrolase [Chloroflexota bacterium]
PTTAPTKTPNPTAAPTKASSPTTAPTKTPNPTAAPTKASSPTMAPTKTSRPTAAPTKTLNPTASAAATPAESATVQPLGFDYGFQISPVDGSRLSSAITAVQDAGFNWVKVQVSWADSEPDFKGGYAWAKLDEFIAKLDAAGLKVLLTVNDAPDWARSAFTDKTVSGPPADPQDMADFMAALAGRYQGKVQALEVWSAQNLAYEWGYDEIDAERYVELLCAVFKAVKAVDPNIAIISGGLMPTGVTAEGISIDDLEYLRQMYAAGCKACMDGVGVHPLGYNNPPDARIDYTNPDEPTFKVHRSFYFRETMLAYHELMVLNGDAGKRLWPTEFGWASSSDPNPGYEYAADVTEAEQAQYLVRAYQMMKEWGWVGPAFAWNLNYGVTDPGSSFAHFSVWERQAYDSLRAMTK